MYYYIVMIKSILKKLSIGENLTAEETSAFIQAVAIDEVTPSQLGAFILGITAKTPTVDEITGIVVKLREFAHRVNFGNKDVVCPCGTGADNSGSFNISTASALVCASDESVIVAKHANCAISSQCGSSNVLEELGIKLAKTPEEAIEQAYNFNVTFLHSPFFNTAISKINPIRRELGMRTLFNFTGPMINPSFPTGQAFGASSVEMAEKMIEVLRNTGSKRAMIFTGINPIMDEISVCGETIIQRLQDGIIDKISVSPEDFGIKRASLEELKGSDIKGNAEIIRGIFKNEIQGPKKDIVALNAAALFWAAGKVEKLEDGLSLSYNLIEEGNAYNKLEELKCQKIKQKK
jgi:anthranilate phosphoribosyltransferase